MSRKVILLAAAAALLAVALSASSGTVRRLEQRTIDSRFHIRGERSVSGIAVVGIDDITFNRLGLAWPFPRSLHARLVDRLREAGVRQIVYDVQFTEQTRRREDFALYDAVGRARGTILATGQADAHGNTNIFGGEKHLRRIGAEAAAAAVPAGPDGVLRRYQPKAGPLTTIAAAVARRLGHPVPASRFHDGRALIDFAGPAGTIPTYPFVDVLSGKVPDSELRGRIVVVGATSPTLQDRHPTAAGSRLMAGPEIQANAIETAIHGNPLQEAPGWVAYVLLVALGAAGGALVAFLGAPRGTLGAAGVAIAFCVVAQVVFDAGLVLPVAAPLIALAAATLAADLAAVAQETAERRRVAGRNLALEEAVRERTEELEVTHLEAVQRLARAAELRDGDTGEHLDRMSLMCEAVALRLGLSAEEALRIRRASILHDVGKIGLPDRILRKPGKLTDEEIEIMRRHTLEGAALLSDSRSPVLRTAEIIARTHHERWDGTGYPLGLREDEIPIAGRIAAVCDVYDALISERPYKRAWTPEEAQAELVAQRGRHFDPRAVDALLAVLGSKPRSRV